MSLENVKFVTFSWWHMRKIGTKIEGRRAIRHNLIGIFAK